MRGANLAGWTPPWRKSEPELEVAWEGTELIWRWWHGGSAPRAAARRLRATRGARSGGEGLARRHRSTTAAAPVLGPGPPLHQRRQGRRRLLLPGPDPYQRPRFVAPHADAPTSPLFLSHL